MQASVFMLTGEQAWKLKGLNAYQCMDTKIQMVLVVVELILNQDMFTPATKGVIGYFPCEQEHINILRLSFSSSWVTARYKVAYK